MASTTFSETRSRQHRSAFAAFGAWMERRHQRQNLAALDPSMLKDIGISACDRDRECRKPFWRG